MDKILNIAYSNQKTAWEIIQNTNIIKLWKLINAKVNLVGSLPLGLLMKHRDIDFHIYSDQLDLGESFNVMAKLAENKSIKKIENINLIHTKEECIEWHAWYENEKNELWQMDMIHIRKGSFFDGYAEKLVERLKILLSEETRNRILKLKYETPDTEKILGIEYYVAVLRDNVKSFEELQCWRIKNPVTDVVTWIP